MTGAVIGFGGRGVAEVLIASLLGPGELDFGAPLPAKTSDKNRRNK